MYYYYDEFLCHQPVIDPLLVSPFVLVVIHIPGGLSSPTPSSLIPISYNYSVLVRSMESYPAVAPLWDLSQPSSFSQLPDDDFLALLQKQFSTTNDGFNPGVFDTGINPQSIQSPDGPSPPSDDSSPSPPSVNNDSNSKGESRRPRADTDGDDSILKRKASIDSMSDGPNQKNQHTGLVNCFTLNSQSA